jgi:hypothetical protein
MKNKKRYVNTEIQNSSCFELRINEISIDESINNNIDNSTENNHDINNNIDNSNENNHDINNNIDRYENDDEDININSDNDNTLNINNNDKCEDMNKNIKINHDNLDSDNKSNNEEWQLLNENTEINDKISMQSYILSDLNKNVNDKINIDNTNYIKDFLQKSIRNNLINLISDNEIFKLLINPAIYISFASILANVSLGIGNKILTTYTNYSFLLDKTINDKIVNYYYSKAFEIAYLQLINDCINSCMPYIIKINTLNHNYNKSFTETIALNIGNDMLLITVKNITYVFSKYYFLNNDVVQDKITNILCKIISNITVTFINGLLEGTYYILIERK